MLGRKAQEGEESRSSVHSTGMSQAWEAREHLSDLCRCVLCPGAEAPRGVLPEDRGWPDESLEVRIPTG